MMRNLLIFTALLCAAVLCGASPYGRALQQARKVAGQGGGGDAFRQIWMQMDQVIRQNRGALPAPAGIDGLRKLCGPGKVDPALLKLKDPGKLSEKNCSWAYVGSELGVLRVLPRDGGFPVLFTKPAPGVRQISVLFADGRSRVLDARTLKNCSSVINYLKRSSRAAASPVWKKLSVAAARIDRAHK
jgi:hypothetical protein